MKALLLTQEVYNYYYGETYIMSVLCAQNVLEKLENDYKLGIIKEKNVLLVIKDFLSYHDAAIFLTDERIKDNIEKIVMNSSIYNNDIVNEIKVIMNSVKEIKSDNYPFLRTQYIVRKYGFNNLKQLRGKYEREMFGLSNPFLEASKEKIYSTLDFDFRLVQAIPNIKNNLDFASFYDECLYNYQFLSSINYFKFNYSNLLNDVMFLSFIAVILEYQNLNKENLEQGNYLFDNFHHSNLKTLKDIKRRIKKL